MNVWIFHIFAALFSTSDFTVKQVTCWTTVCPQKLQAIKHEYVKSVEDDVIKSPNDKRQYRGLELTNGMKVMLVNDDNTTQSSVTLIVNAGLMNGPKHLPEVAHFLEHLMMTQGTKKYPEESGFEKFLSSHGGRHNAETGFDFTYYFFNVLHEFLPEALDRCAQNLIAPQFTTDFIGREIDAVNSEFESGLQDDSARWFHLLKTHADPTHDYYTSLVGSKQVLMDNAETTNTTLLAEIVKFFDEFYSANLMSLAVISNRSLDEMVFMVIPLFGLVPNKNLKAPYWPVHPYGGEQLGYYVEIEPVQDVHEFAMQFPCGDYEKYYKSKPWAYVSHLLNRKGKDSLFDMLQRDGLIVSFGASMSRIAKGFGFIQIGAILSEKGLLRIQDVLEMIMKYVHFLKSQPIQRWIHEEIAKISEIDFSYLTSNSDINYAEELAEAMFTVPAKHATYHGYVMDEYEPDLIKKVLDHIDADNMNIYVWSNTFKGKTDKQEKWYGTKYSMKKIDENLMKTLKLEEVNPKNDFIFKFPEPNRYLPSDFDILRMDDVMTSETEEGTTTFRGISKNFTKNVKTKVSEFQTFPKIIQETDQTRIWYLRDTIFYHPEVYLYFDLRSPIANQSPDNVALSLLLYSLINDDVRLKTEGAYTGGLRVNINALTTGYRLTFIGYNQKMADFVTEVFRSMTSSDFNQKFFESIKESYAQILNDEDKKTPLKLADSYAKLLFTSVSWSHLELLASVKDATLKQVVKFRHEFFSKLHIEMFAYGNIRKSGAVKIMNDAISIIKEHYKTRPLFVGEMESNRLVELKPGHSFLYVAETKIQPESSVSVIFQMSKYSLKNQALNSLIGEISQQLCHAELRTKDQLGYIAGCKFSSSSGVNSAVFDVQGDKSPDIVESRIEALIVKLQETISGMPMKEFETYKDSYVKLLLEKVQTMPEMAWRVWSEIASEIYFFNRAAVFADTVKNVTKRELLSYFKENLNINSPKRRKLSIYIVSTRNSSIAEKMDLVNTANMTIITSIATFKNAMGLYGIPKPHVDLKPLGIDPLEHLNSSD